MVRFSMFLVNCRRVLVSDVVGVYKSVYETCSRGIGTLVYDRLGSFFGCGRT